MPVHRATHIRSHGYINQSFETHQADDLVMLPIPSDKDGDLVEYTYCSNQNDEFWTNYCYYACDGILCDILFSALLIPLSTSALVDEVQSNMTDNRNSKSSSLILLLLILSAMLILPSTTLTTSTVALPIPSSGKSYDSIANRQVGRRMDIEMEDYSEAGANNRHDPPPPSPTQP